MIHRQIKLALISILLLSSTLVAANQIQFTELKFNELSADGAYILIDVHAPWCPTCKRQGEIINAYFEKNPKTPLTVMKVDFDSQKQWVKHFKAPRQSTLVLFKGQERLWFSVAETDQEGIFVTLDKHLKPKE